MIESGLAIDVHPPQDVANALPLPGGIRLPQVGDGPYPTLIEYSGYGYADPAGPQSGIAILANPMGFAVVDTSPSGRSARPIRRGRRRCRSRTP